MEMMSTSQKRNPKGYVMEDPYLFRHILSFIEDEKNERSSYPVLVLALTFRTMRRLVSDKVYKLQSKSTQYIYSLSLLKWMVEETGDTSVFKSRLCVAAAAHGTLEVIDWLQQPTRGLWTIECYNAAAATGRIDVLAALDAMDVPCRFDHTAAAAAAGGGHLEALQWLRSHDKPWKSDTLHAAAMNNHLHVLEWCLSQTDAPPLTRGTFSNAAFGGHLDTLQWLISRPDIPQDWKRDVCVSAARNGHLHVIKFARSLSPPCPWDERLCDVAALGGHLHVLQWVRSQESPCPWTAKVCTQAVFGGHFNVLKWLRSEESPHGKADWTTDTACAASATGSLEILRWLREQNPPCPWDHCVYNVARGCGHTAIMEWLQTVSPACPATLKASVTSMHV